MNMIISSLYDSDPFISYQNKKLEMLNYIKDSLERKIASVTASIEVLESQISRDNEVEVTN